MYDLLKRWNTNTSSSCPSGLIGSIWLDWCCTFDGERGGHTKARIDLELLFARQLLPDQGVLGVTLSWRKMSAQGRDKDANLSEFLKEVPKIADRHRYTLKLDNIVSYPPMMTAFYWVKKEASPSDFDSMMSLGV